MYEVVAKESSNKKSQIIGTSNDVEIKSKDINDHYKVTEFNIDLIYNEITFFIIGSLLIYVCYKFCFRLDIIILILSFLFLFSLYCTIISV